MNRVELRALVARMQGQVTAISSSALGEDEKRELVSSWNSLVQHLAVGPAPDTRACPHCKATIMRVATLCGHCWTKCTSWDPPGGPPHESADAHAK